MEWFFYTGIIAAICIAVFSMPQLFYTIKTKDTAGVKLAMFILLAAGDLFFVISGLGIVIAGDLSSGLPILLANIFGFLSSLIIIFYKIRNTKWAKKLNMTEKDFCVDWKKNKEKLKIANKK